MTGTVDSPWLQAISDIEAGARGYDLVLMVVPPALQDSVQVELSTLLRPSSCLGLTIPDDGRGAYGNLGGTLLAWRQARAMLGPLHEQKVLLVHDAGAARRTGLLANVLLSRGSLPLPGGRSLRTQVLRAGLPLSASCRPGQVDVLWGGQIVLPSRDPLSIGFPEADLVKLSRLQDGSPTPTDLSDLGWIRARRGHIEAFAPQGSFPHTTAWAEWSRGKAAADLGSFRLRSEVLDAWVGVWKGEKIDLDPDLLAPLIAGVDASGGRPLLDLRSPTIGVSELGPGAGWWRFRRPIELHRSLCEMLDDAHGRALLGLSERPSGDRFFLGPDIEVDPTRLRVRDPRSGGAWLEAPLSQAGEGWEGGARPLTTGLPETLLQGVTAIFAKRSAEVAAAGPPGSAWSGLAGLVSIPSHIWPPIAIGEGELKDALRGLLHPGAAPIAGPHRWIPNADHVDPASLVWRDPREDLDASRLARGLAGLPKAPPGDAVGLLAWARARLVLDGWDQPTLSASLSLGNINPAARALGFFHLDGLGWFPNPGPWPGEPGRQDPLAPVARGFPELVAALDGAATIGLVGPAAAGKTTTSRLLTALLGQHQPVRRIDGDLFTRPGPGLRFVVEQGRRRSFIRGPAIYDEPALREVIRHALAQGPGVLLVDHVFLGLDRETHALLDRLVLVDPGDSALRTRRKLDRDRDNPNRQDDLATDLCLKAYEEVSETWPWLRPDVVYVEDALKLTHF